MSSLSSWKKDEQYLCGPTFERYFRVTALCKFYWNCSTKWIIQCEQTSVPWHFSVACIFLVQMNKVHREDIESFRMFSQTKEVTKEKYSRLPNKTIHHSHTSLSSQKLHQKKTFTNKARIKFSCKFVVSTDFWRFHDMCTRNYADNTKSHVGKQTNLK